MNAEEKALEIVEMYIKDCDGKPVPERWHLQSLILNALCEGNEPPDSALSKVRLSLERIAYGTTIPDIHALTDAEIASEALALLDQPQGSSVTDEEILKAGKQMAKTSVDRGMDEPTAYTYGYLHGYRAALERVK